MMHLLQAELEGGGIVRLSYSPKRVERWRVSNVSSEGEQSLVLDCMTFAAALTNFNDRKRVTA